MTDKPYCQSCEEYVHRRDWCAKCALCKRHCICGSLGDCVPVAARVVEVTPTVDWSLPPIIRE